MAIPNTTPTKVVALASDGWKRTGFPDGTLPPPSAPPEFTTSTTSSSITATITNANGATSFRVRVDSGTAVDGLTVSGLTAETPYSFQVQGVNEFGESSWSAPVSITTDAASTGLTDPSRLFEIKIDAVGGTLGGDVEDSTGIQDAKDVFTGGSAGTTYSDEFQIDGQNVLRLSCPTGTTGFGTLGGSIIHDNHQSSQTKLFKGDEFWVKTKIRFPSVGWEWNPYGRNKFFRHRVFTSAGASTGYIDLYLDPEEKNNTGKQIWWIYEGEQVWVAPPNTTPISLDTDHDIEMHIVLDNVAGIDGGEALQRVWVDGALVLEDTRRTLTNATDEMSLSALFYYYDDNGPDQDVHCYVKEYIVRSSVPGQTDAAGNPFIGV